MKSSYATSFAHSRDRNRINNIVLVLFYNFILKSSPPASSVYLLKMESDSSDDSVMMANKLKVLSTPILCVNEETINSIIQCMCVLHNFIWIREGRTYQPQYHNSKETEMNINIGIKLKNENNNLPTRNSASGLRDYLSNYFIQPQSALPWQWNYCTS